jgi:hypothetical protein
MKKYNQKISQSLFVCGMLFVGQATMVEAAATSSVPMNTTVATSSATSTQVHDAVAVEKQVRDYFADIPVMIEIARCESKFRQFTDAGNVLRGGSGGGMVGIFQFFESIHAKTALGLGFDLKTVEGNVGYARHLYTSEGTSPWASCVPAVLPVTAVVMSPATMELKIKLLTQVVELLKELLKLELAKAEK